MKTNRKNVLSILYVLSAALIIAASAFSISFGNDAEYTEKFVFIDESPISEPAYTIKGSVYINLDTLKKYGSCEKIQIDEKNTRVVMDPAKLKMFLGSDAVTAFVKENCGEVYVPLKVFKGDTWISLTLFCDIIKLGYELDGDCLYITRFSKNCASVSEDAANAAADDLTEKTLGRGRRLIKEGETGSYYILRTLDGTRLYASKNSVSIGSEGMDISVGRKDQRKPDYKINLAWVNPSDSGVTQLAPSPSEGVDVLSPRWFNLLVDAGGAVNNVGDRGYVELCRKNGYKVWICVTNNFSKKGSTNFTNKVLSDKTLRNKTAAQFIFYSSLYDTDGINVDFEELKDADRGGFTEFIKTLSLYCRDLGMTLSVDVPAPQDWYTEYDYEALGKYCDYVCAMTYDEHYTGSAKAGSISSRSFYTKGINDLKTYVPAGKLLMGIPFYSAFWTTTQDNSKVSFSRLRMTSARTKVESIGAEPQWNEKWGQYYLEYDAGLYTGKAWLEDARSVAQRLAFVFDSGIAGSCCWEYDYAEDGIFDIFAAIFKHGADPASFSEPYSR